MSLLRPNIQLTVARLVLALAVAAFVMIAAGAAAALYEFFTSSNAARQAELQHEVELATSLVRGLAARDPQHATERAIEALRPVRFGENGYLFIQDFKGVARLMPLAPDLEGTDLNDRKDAQGRFFFKEMLNLARSGKSGVIQYTWPKPGESAATEKLSYIMPIPELGLYIGSGAYTDDIARDTYTVFRSLGFVVAPLLGLFFAIAYFIDRRIVLRLSAMATALRELASGNFAVTLPGLTQQDEFGDMARAIETFKIKAAEAAKAEEAQREQHRAMVAETRKKEMSALASHFERAVGGVVDGVAQSAQHLENIARSLVADARNAGEQAGLGAQSAATASANINSVAAAAEELSHSVVEIGGQAARSHDVSSSAANEAKKTNARMTELANAVGHIGGIVNIITEIAQQTNLLALNATIEAARAGEAGRGFAVVASEVKTLADQTQKATAEVAAQIASVQTASEDAIDSIAAMTEATREVNSIASTIADAVEAQGEATREIALNVHETSARTGELSKVISEVKSASMHTGAAAEEVLQSVSELAGQTEKLRTECNAFLSQVRAA